MSGDKRKRQYAGYSMSLYSYAVALAYFARLGFLLRKAFVRAGKTPLN
jgi:hypothetical protein